MTTSGAATLCCAGNVFAGSIFAGAAVPAKQEYSIQIPVYVSLDIVPLTQILKCTQISCFTSSQNKDIEQLNMPLANISELIQLPGSMAPTEWTWSGYGHSTKKTLPLEFLSLEILLELCLVGRIRSEGIKADRKSLSE